MGGGGEGEMLNFIYKPCELFLSDTVSRGKLTRAQLFLTEISDTSRCVSLVDYFILFLPRKTRTGFINAPDSGTRDDTNFKNPKWNGLRLYGAGNEFAINVNYLLFGATKI